MGEIADMMLDGEMCPHCGEFNHGEAMGFRLVVYLHAPPSVFSRQAAPPRDSRFATSKLDGIETVLRDVSGRWFF